MSDAERRRFVAWLRSGQGHRPLVPLVSIRAPSLPTDADWINVASPLTDEDLRGRIVLLHFFTYA